ncbi:hypothetical protein [Roseovarius sp. E0-M6]|uniref:hypothetical protein n=1 Tax=Roseovarius sp. E0-M6 TaxID=3127118 RepID=UPI0030104720
MVYVHKDPTVEAGVVALLRNERGKARTREDWERALKSYGYGLNHTRENVFVTTFPHGVEICRLPGDLI